MSIHFEIENEVITQEVFIGAGIISLLVTVTCLLSCFCPDPRNFICFSFLFPKETEYELLSPSFPPSSNVPIMGSSPSSTRRKEAEPSHGNSIESKYLNAGALSEQSRNIESGAFSHASLSKLSEIDLKTVTPLQRLDRSVTPVHLAEPPRNVMSGKMEEEILVVDEDNDVTPTSYHPDSLIQGCIPHTVTKSDTLSGISLQYNVSAADIKRANKLYNDRDIHMFDTLMIPVDTQLFFQSLDAAEQKRRAEVIRDLALRCSVEEEVAEAYLQANGWSLQKSLHAFDLDAQAAHQSDGDNPLVLLSLRPTVEKMD